MSRWWRALILLVIATHTLAAASAQVKQTSGAPLGAVSFQNSGAPAAQADFLRGVAWLHSFGYEEAIEAFRAAQKVDPSFALAYWGEALSFNQPLWFNEDAEKGRAVLGRLGSTVEARVARPRTLREQGYLRAVEALWGTGPKPARDKAYADAMAALVKAFPEDDEAKAFYALALLAMLPRGDASLPLRQQAGALVEGVFARNAKHPGAPHYILHAYDHSTLAPKALPAAHAYALIAPAASHALHMPAHAFVQLGLWDAAAASDQASWEASIAWVARRGVSTALRDYHSLSWLHYEWTQQGRFQKAAEALRIVDEAMKTLKPEEQVGRHHYADSTIGRGSGPMALRNDRGSLRARAVIESERWSEMKGQGSFDNIDELFALGMSAVKLGEPARAVAARDLFAKAAAPGQDPELREQAAIMVKEIDALVAMAERQPAQAFAAMDAATALQAKMSKPIGRPYPVKGADELYGELLLEAGRPKEAMAWFERTLVRTPNRSRAVLGLARAAAKAGEPVKSRSAYKQFLANWHLADKGLRELAEARAAVK
ncbi:MAG: hypothetical protein LC791_18200 [Acidobacteria bacterium]|nr:hypothetical protein [Acidobacteriota bacterium]